MIDIAGKTFGRLLALWPLYRSKQGMFWVCQCSDGNICTVRGEYLRSGRSKSCGCIRKEKEDITGLRFGRLIALKVESGSDWLCRCDCGSTKIIHLTYLTKELVLSCGCLKEILNSYIPKIKNNVGRKRKWCPVYLSEWRAFANARNRCRNKNCKDWKYYGGRGIEFKFKSFQEFFAEIGHRPKGFVLDRRDNDGHYEKGNIRWTTPRESILNSRRPANR